MQIKSFSLTNFYWNGISKMDFWWKCKLKTLVVFESCSGFNAVFAWIRALLYSGTSVLRQVPNGLQPRDFFSRSNKNTSRILFDVLCWILRLSAHKTHCIILALPNQKPMCFVTITVHLNALSIFHNSQHYVNRLPSDYLVHANHSHIANRNTMLNRVL